MTSAWFAAATTTGNGRRESYEFTPLPRMTNAYVIAGSEKPEDIIRSVSSGIYVTDIAGVQVDIANDKLVTTGREAYLIEDGRLTCPIKDPRLVGRGRDMLMNVSLVGHDFKLDDGVGTCGQRRPSCASCCRYSDTQN